MGETISLDDYTTLPGKSGATHSISLCIAAATGQRRQCIALTKRKACRASLLWAKRRRGGAVWSNLNEHIGCRA